jgi:hypothetical protein
MRARRETRGPCPWGKKMKKAEAKETLISLFPKWRDARGLSDAQLEHPSFSDFKLWLRETHYSHYLNFRSVMGADVDAEMWFDEYFGQRWRN